ncbi:hypothetical protein CJU90_6363 [Yarrowia sp. C11]|nr:hypothetical protein CJU90_6363 [Yarrowia sp. C11]
MSRVTKPEQKKTNANTSELKKLLANPTQEISTAKPPPPSVAPPPDVIYTFTGSTAGAGSGEFHVYKHARHKEAERLKYINEAAQKDTERDEFLKRREEQQQKDAEKTNKNRARRQKRKQANTKKPTKTSDEPKAETLKDSEESTPAPEPEVKADVVAVANTQSKVDAKTQPTAMEAKTEPEPAPEKKIIDADAAF